MNGTEKHTIIVIDPKPETNDLVRYAADLGSVKVVHFSSALVAVENIKDIKPGLIFCEIYSDDLTAEEAFRLLNSDLKYRAYRNVPFIIFTSSQTADKDELITLGVSGWFTKPFGRRELKEVIENLLLSSKVIERSQKLQQQIKRSEYQYRDLIENANDFIFILDEQGAFTYINNRFSSLTGWQKNQWIHKPFISCIHPDDRILAREQYTKVHQGKARIFEARIQGNRQESVVLSFNISSLFSRGTIAGSLGIARDVTEQKAMELEILELKNFNESIIQSMESGLLTFDMKGRISFLNTGGEKILGWKAAEVTDIYLSDLIGQEKADLFLSISDTNDPLKNRKEVKLDIGNEEDVYLGFSTTERIDNNGNRVGTLVFFRDISMLKQMQSEVIRMDRLVSLGVLASGIAHEIKNPLAGIKAMAQACEEEFELDDSRTEYLTRIVRQVNRLDDLLKTFFAYARPKKPDRKPHNLSNIINEVTRLLSKKLSTSEVKYIEKYQENLPPMMVDSQQMQQVLLNLILNAIDAMPKGGTLTITGEITADKRRNRPNICVSVSDTGNGIPKEKIETIFDPFYTTKPTGLGLGLSIVYRIINEHDGEIFVESGARNGTTFKITLPAGE